MNVSVIAVAVFIGKFFLLLAVGGFWGMLTLWPIDDNSTTKVQFLIFGTGMIALIDYMFIGFISYTF